MLRLQLSCEGERVWISCPAGEKVRHVLDLAGKRWEKVLGRKAGHALWVRYDGAKLDADDVLGTFVADKDVLEVGFETRAAAVPVVTGETVAQDMEQLEKALQELFEGGKTVSELEEFRGLPEPGPEQGGEDDEGDDDDEHAVCLAVAMYNFVPEEEDEIGFRIGDELIVYRKREDGWWRGRQMRPGSNPVGYFPGNRVKEIDVEEVKKAAAAPVAKEKEEAESTPVAGAVAPSRSFATMEREEIAVKVESAPGHGSPEMLRAAVLETEETRVEVWRATMDTETETVHVHTDKTSPKKEEPKLETVPEQKSPRLEESDDGNKEERGGPSLPRRSVSMDSKALSEAARLAERGDWPAADKILSEALEVCPRASASVAALYVARAEARERQGRMREALLDYSSCLQAQPRHLAALLGRARLAAQASKHAVARHDCLSALRIQPKCPEALLGAAAAEEALSNPAAAASHLECLLAHEPTHGAALLQLARLRAAAKDHAAARDLLNRAVVVLPGDAGAWLQLGAACTELRAHREAIAALGQSVGLNPGDWAAWRAKAMAHASLSEWRDACENFSTALHCAGPAAPFSLHAELAVALTRLNRHAEAQLQWQAALERRADDPWLIASLAACLRHNGKAEEAYAQASRALELDPRRAKVLLLRGQLALAIGRPQPEAVADFTLALVLEPGLTAAKEELKKLSDK